MASNVFDRVGSAHVSRSVFDLSASKLFTFNIGKLIPVVCEEMVPGDVFKMSNEIVIRMQPLVAPILHRLDVTTHTFFVPYRILWDQWETYITGGVNGNDNTPIIEWRPTTSAEIAVGSLWDYLGFATDLNIPSSEGLVPIDFPRRAYNMIYNEYYRDINLIPEIPLTSTVIQTRAYKKDYFTSALPFQQRGLPPSLPLSGLGNVEFFGPTLISSVITYGAAQQYRTTNFAANNITSPINIDSTTRAPQLPMGLRNPLASQYADTSNNNPYFVPGDLSAQGVHAFTRDRTLTGTNRLNFSDVATFDISDLRLAWQLQRWLERNARSGVRYTEFLRAHYGVSPSDSRLQRPEYIGGTKSPLIISEVLQTSETSTSPQGTMAGHGITAGNGYIGRYRAEEFGILMTILSVLPKASYEDRLDRQWIKTNRFDFFSPEFQFLSEQGVYSGEIRHTMSDDDKEIFGFQGRFDEMRIKHDQVMGEMRQSYSNNLSYWHLSRHFSPNSPLPLSKTFVEVDTVSANRIFAVHGVHQLICHYGSRIRATRPLAIEGNPGLVDHI